MTRTLAVFFAGGIVICAITGYIALVTDNLRLASFGPLVAIAWMIVVFAVDERLSRRDAVLAPLRSSHGDAVADEEEEDAA